MITFENVWLWQDERPILKDVSFMIKSNERVAVLGPSGAGKTTILKLILGLLSPDTGKVICDTIDLSSISINKLNKLRLNYSIVFQEGALFDSLSVRDNVGFFYKEYSELPPDEIDNHVEELLRTVDLEDAIDMMPEQLSGGMKRRVAIARSLAVSDALMHLYDEPTSGLDPVNAGMIRNLILKLSSNGRGFIIVTHEIFAALSLALRFMFLKDGVVLFDGNKEQFLHSNIPQLTEFLAPYQYILEKL
jgi:phospholipid/cholesterol/gamma-HCH transport system ATP-binding protein